MKNVERIFHWCLHAALIIYIFFIQMCSGSGKVKIGKQNCGDVVEINIQKKPVYFPTYVPVPYEVRVPGEKILDSIPYLDSNYCKQLALMYYTEKEYKDTLKDSVIDIFIDEYVSANRIHNRSIGYKIKKPFITLSNDRFQVFASANLGTDLKGFVAGPELLFKDKRGFLYKAGVDFNTTGNITYRLGFGLLIRLKKR